MATVWYWLFGSQLAEHDVPIAADESPQIPLKDYRNEQGHSTEASASGRISTELDDGEIYSDGIEVSPGRTSTESDDHEIYHDAHDTREDTAASEPQSNIGSRASADAPQVPTEINHSYLSKCFESIQKICCLAQTVPLYLCSRCSKCFSKLSFANAIALAGLVLTVLSITIAIWAKMSPPYASKDQNESSIHTRRTVLQTVLLQEPYATDHHNSTISMNNQQGSTVGTRSNISSAYTGTAYENPNAQHYSLLFIFFSGACLSAFLERPSRNCLLPSYLYCKHGRSPDRRARRTGRLERLLPDESQFPLSCGPLSPRIHWALATITVCAGMEYHVDPSHHLDTSHFPLRAGNAA